MKALIFVGSEREHSYTAALARAVGQALEPVGIGYETVPAAPWQSGAAGLLDRLADADAVVLVTPVYHAGYSALLKGVLDGLPGDALAGKAVALAANGSGPRSGSAVCDQLRTVARAMGGWVVPTQVAGCPDDFLPAGGAPAAPTPELAERCAQVAAELQRLAAAFRAPAVV
ncbi:NADPH-dependent FMN reductase [Kitasatospora sp. NPDC049285]|uniref:NADPH-dependent FMN reductase n=1 Tax=Kitasatospora sp. NPDC049285 TaxID=3157096 RepID=UPI00341373DB